ncbi:N-acetyltransferase family protein [Limosilactobacillus sp.]|jgi:L-amino acid N-acyltransferase YncA|uniref:GNAT family N-acetyltransferase n=1 Tax=Limosilactobacillus sp. TaxID=2773925 RepID=UPI0035A0CADB
MAKNVTIRVARLTDAPRLVEIYAPYVKKTVITFEYTVPTVDDFRQRMANTLVKYPYIVVEQGNQVVGYAYVGPFVGRKAYDWSVETSIYIDPECRHNGIGGQLYAALEKILKEMGILNLNACIGYPVGKDDKYLTKNSAQFHRHLGYRLVGEFHRCGYKFNCWYDMIWMEKMLGDHPQIAQPIKNFNDVRAIIAKKYGIK